MKFLMSLNDEGSRNESIISGVIPTLPDCAKITRALIVKTIVNFSYFEI